MTWDHFELNRIDTVKDYVCTFDQSKKLYELGIKKQSLFYFQLLSFFEENKSDALLIEAFDGHESGVYIFSSRKVKSYKKIETYSAFTSQELGELIDKLIYERKSEWYQIKELKQNIDDYYFYIDGKIIFNIGSKSEAISRAEFLIYLLENK